MANALSTPLKPTASAASLGAASVATSDSAAVAANGGSAGKGAGDGRVHIEGLEGGGFDYLRTTARARRDLCSLLLRLMQVCPHGCVRFRCASALHHAALNCLPAACQAPVAFLTRQCQLSALNWPHPPDLRCRVAERVLTAPAWTWTSPTTRCGWPPLL